MSGFGWHRCARFSVLIIQILYASGLLPETSFKWTNPIDGSKEIKTGHLALFSSNKKLQKGRKNSVYGSENRFDPNKPSVDWEVFVDQTKSADKRSSATLDAFIGLAPPSVEVKPAVFPRSKLKGPRVRCIAVNPSSLKPKSFDACNVDSVDKVFRILTKHMGEEVSKTNCDCLKWKFEGNGYLEAGEVDLAIDAYNKAIETGVERQEGVVLLMRATAYLQRAAAHKEELKGIVNELVRMVPVASSLQIVYEEAMRQPTLANAILGKILEDTDRQEKQFRKTQYRHGLYQYALLQAAEDALRATQLLPSYATSWIRAGEILSELWKLKESAQYFERAIELDESLSSTLRPVINRLRKRQELLDTARAFGWSEDTLRLALDVAR